MIVLGINTSTPEGSVALMGDKSVISEYILNVQATHSERLLPSIDRLLKETGIVFSELSGIAVTVGPGSFTGLRIGLASAKGLAMASSLPLLGVSTLEAMARNLPFCCYPICPLLNARKGEVYWGLYQFEGEKLIQMEREAVAPPEAIADWIREKTVFLGGGAVDYARRIKGMLNERALFAPVAAGTVRASVVAEMGMERLQRGEKDDPAALVPRYVRRLEAEIKWEIRIGG
jgi:tRNA threonylcarbamoyladenosine biosynthesis protein TsaB